MQERSSHIVTQENAVRRLLHKIPKKNRADRRRHARRGVKMIKVCPHCNQRYTTANHVGDYVHQCANTSTVLTQEDVLITGQDVTEFGASVDTGVKPGNAMLQGSVNRFWGTRPQIEGEQFGGVTQRGANKQTHRQRQHYQYIEEEEENGFKHEFNN